MIYSQSTICVAPVQNVLNTSAQPLTMADRQPGPVRIQPKTIPCDYLPLFELD